MGTNDFSYFIENKVGSFNSEEVDFILLSKYKQLVKDKTYFDFVIESKNCGFFYGQSLHIYGYAHINKFHDIEYINSLLQDEYGDIFKSLISFGQDLFGNQFCFDIVKNDIVFFNSETGEREVIASGYANWVNVVYERLEYFTGINALKAWLLNNQFDFNQRLCPKVPFIMGGEFKVGNLYAGRFPDFIKAYANIARQVYNLPEGTEVKLNIDKN
jgi:hypothetical protein